MVPGHQVGGGGEAAGVNQGERIGPGGERDRSGEDAQVDQAQGGRQGSGLQFGDQLAAEGQAAEGADHDAEPGGLGGRELAEHRLLDDHAHRGQRGREQAEQHAGHVRRRPLAGTERDHGDAAERDEAADDQPAREPFLQDHAGHDGDQDGVDVDQQGGRAGVEQVFGGVQGHVVAAEPHDAVGQDGPPFAAPGQAPELGHHQQAQHDGGNGQPAEGQGAGGEARAHGPDAHEGGGPQDHGDDDGGDAEPADRGRLPGRGLVAGCGAGAGAACGDPSWGPADGVGPDAAVVAMLPI